MAPRFSSWTLLVLAFVGPSLQCTIDVDCSLNGVCSQGNSTCICDAGWTGTDCGVLDIQPARRPNGYNLTSSGTSSWGSKIIQDPDDKDLYHAFIAEFTHGCGLDFWSPYSRIIRAESRGAPDGPYEFQQEVVGHFAHNPTVVYDPAQGVWLLYYIGCPTTVVDGTCEAKNFTCGPGNRKNGESGIRVLQSRDLRNWDTSVGQVLQGQDDLSLQVWNADVTNPSPWPLCRANNDGRGGWGWWNWSGRWWNWSGGRQKCQNHDVLLAYRGCPYNCSGAEQISLARAPNPAGPYTRLNNDQPIFTNDGGSEDPFVWEDKRGNFHMLVHSLEPGGGFGGGPKVGRHVYSKSIEGPWGFNSQTLAFSTVVEFDDGTEIEYSRRERPQLYFSEDEEMRPLYLTTGVQEVGSVMSYTLMVPVGGR